jgi:hypothetical protein
MRRKLARRKQGKIGKDTENKNMSAVLFVPKNCE